VAEQIYKVLIMLKRRPGMSVAEFRDYYENHHRPLAGKYAVPGMCRYVRRYLDPLPHLDTKEVTEPEFDVITELWFDRKDAFDGIVWMVSEGQLPADVLEDEHKVFDRARTRYVLVTECEG
jgi:hypothetical protein